MSRTVPMGRASPDVSSDPHPTVRAVPLLAGVLDALAAHASRRPDAVAVVAAVPGIEAPQRLTYRELAGKVAALGMLIEHAVPPRGVLLLRAPNGPDFLAWFFAALAAGRRVFPIHPQLTAAETANAARQSAASAFVAPAAEPFAFSGAKLALADAATISPAPWNSSLNRPRVDGLILQSSGTTGAPKLVYRAGPALDSVAAAGAGAMHLTPDDRVIAAIPLCHSYGVDVLLATIYAGASLRVYDRFDPTAIARDCTDAGAAVFPGVPFMFEALSRARPQGARSSLRLAVSAGAPLPARVAAAMSDSWGVRVGQIYGATELGSVTLNHPSGPLFDPASVGMPYAGASIRILDPDNPERPLATGEEGHVAVLSPSMLSGYIPDNTLDLADGHLLTGDLGRLDAHGRLFITGRVKLLIDAGGLKVNPIEVEEALASHPGVAECVVTALPLSDTVVRLSAWFVAADPSSPPSPAALRQHLKVRLAPYKVPRVFERVDSLPRSPSGKVRRQSEWPQEDARC